MGVLRKVAKSVHKLSKRVEESVKSDPLLFASTFGTAAFGEAGIETLGDISGQVERQLDKGKGGETPSILSSEVDEDDKTKQKKKKLQESILRNSPGIREQSVLNIRG